MLSIRRAILCKRETTYGVDSAPTPAADGVEVFRNPRVVTLDQSSVPREIIRGFFGSFKKIPAAKFVRIGFDMPLAGFGAAGPAAPTAGYDAAIRACGFARTINLGVDVTYTLATENPDSATLIYYKDGRLHKARGWRGNVKPQLRRGQLPRYAFDGIALYDAPVDGAFVMPTLTAYQEPVLCQLGSTSLNLHGLTTAKLESLEIDVGQRLQYRNLMNAAEQVIINGRDTVGSIEIEDDTIAVKDWHAIIRAATLGIVDVTHGTVVGNRVQVTGSNVQLMAPGENEVEEVSHLQMGLDFQPSAAGNNELSIVVK